VTLRTAALLALVAAAAVTARPAAAAGESEWQLSARLGAGTVSIDNRSPWGPVGAVDLEYGLSDAWAARASLGTATASVSADKKTGAPGGEVLASSALAGITYTFDVLRLVPYGELALGAVRFGGAVTRPHITFAAELGVGGDYLVTRRWAVGLSFQYLFAPGDLLSNAMQLGGSPFAFSTTLRGSWIF
jgi:outer membrane protein W